MADAINTDQNSGIDPKYLSMSLVALEWGLLTVSDQNRKQVSSQRHLSRKSPPELIPMIADNCQQCQDSLDQCGIDRH